MKISRLYRNEELVISQTDFSVSNTLLQGYGMRPKQERSITTVATAPSAGSGSYSNAGFSYGGELMVSGGTFVATTTTTAAVAGREVSVFNQLKSGANVAEGGGNGEEVESSVDGSGSEDGGGLEDGACLDDDVIERAAEEYGILTESG